MSRADEATDHTSDGAIVAPSFAYGINTSCRNNIHYLDGQRLLYPAGQFFVSAAADEGGGKSTFIPSVASAHAVRLLQPSLNKRYLAAAERAQGAEQPQVSVYNIPAQKREQTLQLAPHTRSSTVVALSFSGDTKLLLTLCGRPDWAVLLWRWQQAKITKCWPILHDVVLTVNCDGPTVGACLSPWDDSLLAVAGVHVVKTHRCDVRTGTSKPSNVMMLDSHKSTSVTCICHLVGGMLAIGTNNGRIMTCSTNSILSTHNISPAGSGQGTSSAGTPTAAEDTVSHSGSIRSRSLSGAVLASGASSPASSPKRGKPSLVAPWQEVLKDVSKGSQPAVGAYAVQALVQCGRGFVAAGSVGDIYLFNPAGATGGRGSGTSDAFCIQHKFMFAGPLSSLADGPQEASSNPGFSLAAGDTDADSSSVGIIDGSSPFSYLEPSFRVCGLAVSPTDEHLAISTAAGKLLLLNVAAAVEAREEAAEASSNSSSGDGGGTAASLPGSGDGGCGATGEPAVALEGPVDKHGGGILQAPGWRVVAGGFPTARIVGLDAAQHLPLLLVASEDGWVRVWDWMRHTQLAARHIGDRTPLCCSLHPSGLLAAVGTNDTTMSVFWVLKGSLSPVAELPVAKCNVVRYSHAGGLLAAAGGSNIISVYPAYYGHEGAAGRARSSRLPGHSRAAAAAAGSSDGGAVLEAVAVLKGHVSSVTDLVFIGDDSRLISTGAGGAVYFWDLSTGSRLIELEYVDKKCVYCSACYSDHHAAVIVRTMDGRLQHIKDGQLVYEASGLAQDCCPLAMTGDGRVALAATSAGSIVSIGWPQHPEASAAAGDIAADLVDGDGFLSFSGAAQYSPASPQASSPTSKQRAGAYQHLSVHVGAANRVLSPRNRANKPDDSALTPRMQLHAGAGVVHGAGAGHAGSKAAAAGTHAHVSRPGTGASSVPSGDADRSSALGPGWHEYRLHDGRITALKILHHAGVLFTASADGLVLMSDLSLVLDGVLIDPPPPTLPLSATAQGNTWATSTTVAAPGLTQQGGLPPPVVMVDDAVIIGLHDKIKALQHKISSMQREAQYQVLRQTQALKESLSSSDSRVTALQAEVAQLTVELEACKQKAVTDQEQILKELEGLHVSAAEQLEGLYEARLALEKERLKQLAAAKDDIELSLKEEMQRRATAAAKELAEVHAMYQQQLAAEASRAEGAAAAAAEADAVWQEVLMQTEEDLEKRAITDSERLATLQHTAEETQVKLRAEANILSRANNKLKAEKAADAARVAALQHELSGLQQQLAGAGSVADKLRAELAERDGVISDNYVTMQGLRRRVQELETHKFVLTYKNEAIAAELQPNEEKRDELQSTVNAQDKELLAGRSALLAAQRAVSERSAAVSAAKQELWEAKRKMAHQSALLEAVAFDIAYVMQQPDERLPGGKTATQVALEKLAVKYCTKRGGGPRTSVQVEAEMMAHVSAAEKKSNILERQLNQALADKQSNSRRLMGHNKTLLADLAELQHTNRDLSLKLGAATRQLAALQAQQEEAAAAAAHTGPAASRYSGSEGPRSCSSSSEAQPGSGPTGSSPRVGRSQGVHMGGQLAPAPEGRYFEAALRQQWQQMAELQTALEATSGIATLQAAQLARLQECVDADNDAYGLFEQQQIRASSPAALLRSNRVSSPSAGLKSSSRPKTADSSRSPANSARVAGHGLARTPSPAGGLPGGRPATSGHQGMMASLKSDLEAWRAK